MPLAAATLFHDAPEPLREVIAETVSPDWLCAYAVVPAGAALAAMSAAAVAARTAFAPKEMLTGPAERLTVENKPGLPCSSTPSKERWTSARSGVPHSEKNVRVCV